MNKFFLIFLMVCVVAAAPIDNEEQDEHLRVARSPKGGRGGSRGGKHSWNFWRWGSGKSHYRYHGSSWGSRNSATIISHQTSLTNTAWVVLIFLFALFHPGFPLIF